MGRVGTRADVGADAGDARGGALPGEAIDVPQTPLEEGVRQTIEVFRRAGY
jgi:hypothetical protein